MPHDLLFVYGSLKRDARGPMGALERQRLEAESRLIGRARCAGRLYDLGSYPGLAPPGSSEDFVHGEVLRMARPAVTLAWLDRYEGIGHGANARSLYRREVQTVELSDGRGVDAWLYIYQGPVLPWRRVHAGVWKISDNL